LEVEVAVELLVARSWVVLAEVVAAYFSWEVMLELDCLYLYLLQSQARGAVGGLGME
jgi:hypothetical protein